MIELSITVDDKRVKRLLKKMTPAVQKAIEKFLIKGGIIVKTQAKANAPVGITGALKGSITSRVDKMKQEVVVGPNVDYDIYQEFGTKFMKAQPYMGPALESNIDNLRDIFIRELNLIIQRI